MKKRGNASVIAPVGLFLPYQQKWITDTARLKLMEKARQIGMTWSTAYRAVETTARMDIGYDQWISSRDDLQARLMVEDCKKFTSVLQLAADDLGEQVIDDSKNSAYVIRFANGHRIHSMSSNPDAQAGKRGGRILDEFALHPDPRKLWAIAYPGLTWGGSLDVISTHRGSANYFNELIREILEKGNPKRISHHKVTLQDALDQGFLNKLQLSLPDGNEILAMDESEYFDYVRSGCADEESFLQEYMCIPADDNLAFLEYDLIASCESSEPLMTHIDPNGEYYAGVDIGRTSDLTVIWVVEKLGDVLVTRMVTTLKKMSKPEQEKILWPIMEQMRRVCMDYTGLGIGWGDDARHRFGTRIELVNFTPKTKEELAYPVRGRMEDRTLRIPFDPAIRADLRSVTKAVAPGGNIRFTAERTKDGHADRFWALALAISAASTPAAPIEHTPLGRNRNSRFYGYQIGG